MFGKKALLVLSVLVTVIAYKANSVYVIDGFENPLRYKMFNLIISSLAKIVISFIFFKLN